MPQAPALIPELRPESTSSGCPDAYCLRFLGTSMEPVYRPGNTLGIDPHIRPLPGDDVVVQFSTDGGATCHSTVRRLISNEGRFVRLRQFNPDLQINLPRRDVLAIHAVAWNIHGRLS